MATPVSHSSSLAPCFITAICWPKAGLTRSGTRQGPQQVLALNSVLVSLDRAASQSPCHISQSPTPTGSRMQEEGHPVSGKEGRSPLREAGRLKDRARHWEQAPRWSLPCSPKEQSCSDHQAAARGLLLRG